MMTRYVNAQQHSAFVFNWTCGRSAVLPMVKMNHSLPARLLGLGGNGLGKVLKTASYDTLSDLRTHYISSPTTYHYFDNRKRYMNIRRRQGRM